MVGDGWGQDEDGKGQGSDESLYKIMSIHKPKYV